MPVSMYWFTFCMAWQDGTNIHRSLHTLVSGIRCETRILRLSRALKEVSSSLRDPNTYDQFLFHFSLAYKSLKFCLQWTWFILLYSILSPSMPEEEISAGSELVIFNILCESSNWFRPSKGSYMRICTHSEDIHHCIRLDFDNIERSIII